MHSLFSSLQETLSQVGPPANSREIQIAYPHFVWWVGLFPMFVFGLILPKIQNTYTREMLILCIMFCIMTYPLFGQVFVPQHILGAYPTIDKEGSLFFFQQDIHIQALWSPIESMQQRGVQLIGFHMGHHWITEFFCLFAPLPTAYNFHILLNFAASTFAMWLWLWKKDTNKTQENRIWLRIGLALLFGCGVHSYVDAQWYTIEKSSLYVIPLLFYSIEYIKKPYITGIIFFVSAYINLYFAIINGMFFLIYLSFHRDVWKHGIGILLTGCIVLLYQGTLMLYSPSIATPEMYLEERARFDSLHLIEFDWARIPLYIALNPIVLWFSIKNTNKERWEIVGFWIFLLLACGPYLYQDMINPVYLVFIKIPFMWRFSEPEIFFHLCLMILYTWTLRSDMSKPYLVMFYLYLFFQLLSIRLPLSFFSV